MFSSVVEAGLGHLWRDPFFKLRVFVRDRTAHSVVAPLLVSTTVYGKDTPEWNQMHCFRTALLSTPHQNDLNLVFMRRTPSSAQASVWWAYRDLLTSRAAAARPEALDKQATRTRAHCTDLQIVIMRRHTRGARGGHSALFAEGSGRRILNDEALRDRLSAFGTVHVFDPGQHAFAGQVSRMWTVDVLVSRMSSQVVSAMFMRPGGLCVEVESSDPAHLYYDHHATFEELAATFQHTFVRSSPLPDSTRLPVMGSLKECRELCKRHNMLHTAQENLDEVRCHQRCRQVWPRTEQFLQDRTRYKRPKWFMNWWLEDVEADVEHVADLVKGWCAQQRRPASAART